MYALDIDSYASDPYFAERPNSFERLDLNTSIFRLVARWDTTQHRFKNPVLKEEIYNLQCKQYRRHEFGGLMLQARNEWLNLQMIPKVSKVLFLVLVLVEVTLLTNDGRTFIVYYHKHWRACSPAPILLFNTDSVV